MLSDCLREFGEPILQMASSGMVSFQRIELPFYSSWNGAHDRNLCNDLTIYTHFRHVCGHVTGEEANKSNFPLPTAVWVDPVHPVGMGHAKKMSVYRTSPASLAGKVCNPSV